MKLTAHEKKEFSRAAAAMYKAGRNPDGHLLSAVAAKSDVPAAQHDRAARAYREWLIGGFKSNPAKKRKRKAPARRARPGVKRARSVTPRRRASPRKARRDLGPQRQEIGHAVQYQSAKGAWVTIVRSSTLAAARRTARALANEFGVPLRVAPG